MPSRAASPIQPPAAVVVTGANGFIAQHCIALLLKLGYRVIGTVRSAHKGRIVKKTHASHENLELAVVDDLTSVQAYLTSLRSFAPVTILHVAAPFDYNATDFERECMLPAVKGTLAVLKAAKELRSVKRVVHTNSFACVYDAVKGLCPNKTYTSDDWCPLTYADGVNAKNSATAYRASKTVAERAAWDFVEDQRLGFDLVSLCLTMVFGPFLRGAQPPSVADINTSNKVIWSVVSAGRRSPVPPTRNPVWVDVRDVAEAHIRAMEVPEAGGGRFILNAGSYCNQEIAEISLKVAAESEDRIPRGEPGRREAASLRIDTRETEEVLGIRWRSLEKCLAELVPQLFEMERSEVPSLL